MSVQAGTANFTVDGKAYRARGSFEFQPLDEEKESIVGIDGYHGFKATPVAPHIKGEISDDGAIAVSDWQLLDGSSVVVLELRNGKVVTLNNAIVVGKVPVNIVDGKYELTLEGSSLRERTAN